jgi:hypothetical protein
MKNKNRFLGAKMSKILAIGELEDENRPSFSSLNDFGTFCTKSKIKETHWPGFPPSRE